MANFCIVVIIPGSSKRDDSDTLLLFMIIERSRLCSKLYSWKNYILKQCLILIVNQMVTGGIKIEDIKLL